MALDIDPRDMFFPTEEEETTLPFTETKEEEKENKKQDDTDNFINTTAFCPHCGAKVRVGVVLLPEP